MKTLALWLAILHVATLSAQIAQPPSHSEVVLTSDGLSYIACDDFQFTNMAHIYGVTWWGRTNSDAGPPQFTIVILSEFLGQPGPAQLFVRATPAMTLTGAEFALGEPEARYDLSFPTSFVAQANARYWIEASGGGTNWGWEGSASGGQNAMRRDLSHVANPWLQMPANLAFSLQLDPAPAQLVIQEDWKLRLYGSVGASYVVEWTDALPSIGWITWTNIVLSSSPSKIDLAGTNAGRRFYRAISIP